MAAEVSEEFPALNTVIHCAGVLIPEDLLHEKSSAAAVEVTVNTNLLGPMRLTQELLPTLRKQPNATILTVTSGLPFIPMAMTPTYCATKAAIHSYTQSLRYQLRETAIQVIEIAPPYVETGLMGDAQANDPNAMPLGDFTAETMAILKSQPAATEVLVRRVLPLRFAEAEGQEKYRQFFKKFNDAVTAQHHG